MGVSAPGPSDIVFTQYMRPHGVRKRVWIERKPETAELARRIEAQGYRFDCEVLVGGQVSFTCELNNPGPGIIHPPIAHEICGNGPIVLATIDKLIAEAAAALGLS